MCGTPAMAPIGTLPASALWMTSPRATWSLLRSSSDVTERRSCTRRCWLQGVDTTRCLHRRAGASTRWAHHRRPPAAAPAASSGGPPARCLRAACRVRRRRPAARARHASRSPRPRADRHRRCSATSRPRPSSASSSSTATSRLLHVTRPNARGHTSRGRGRSITPPTLPEHARRTSGWAARPDHRWRGTAVDVGRATDRLRVRRGGVSTRPCRWASPRTSCRDFFDPLPQPGPGRGCVSGALPIADGRADNPGESWSRVVLIGFGLAPTDLQVRLEDEEGLIGFIDFGWGDVSRRVGRQAQVRRRGRRPTRAEAGRIVRR